MTALSRLEKLVGIYRLRAKQPLFERNPTSSLSQATCMSWARILDFHRCGTVWLTLVISKKFACRNYLFNEFLQGDYKAPI